MKGVPQTPADEGDPLLEAVKNAPIGPPLSDEARAMVEESERFYASGGRGKSQDEIEEMLERKRAERGNASLDR